MNTDRKKEHDNNLVFSYMTLRNLIGISGILLPLLLYLFTSREGADKRIEPSISDYYYTSNGDILVVTLSVLAVFLITYRGYNWKDRIWTIQAAVCALGVAFSPTVASVGREAFSVHTARLEVPHIFGVERHFLFAGWFFICLGVVSLFFFPKTDSPSLVDQFGHKTQKGRRNIVYKVCGIIMLSSVFLLGMYFTFPALKKAIGSFPIIFLMETLAIEAFGLSWLTKGETLWPDGQHYLVATAKKAKQRINPESGVPAGYE